jgi:hypothetical protein
VSGIADTKRRGDGRDVTSREIAGQVI